MSDKNDFLLKDFGKIIKRNMLSIRHELGNDTDAFRIYDRNIDELSIVVEKYAKYLRIIDFSDGTISDEMMEQIRDICYRMSYVQKENVFTVSRKKDRSCELNLKTNNSIRTLCMESGLIFEVEMLSYTDSGLFLENVYARRFIRDCSSGLRVLNLFSYTGSFGLYAASGGAKEIFNVDISENYTKWAERNIHNNGFSPEICRCICSDAKQFIDSSVKNNNKYDIIIFDPPVFSNSRKMDYDFRAERDSIPWLLNLCRVLTKDGFILFCNNSRSLKEGKIKNAGLKYLCKSGEFRAPGFIKKNRVGKTSHYLIFN